MTHLECSIRCSKWAVLGALLVSVLVAGVSSHPMHVYRAIGQNIRQFACQGKLKSNMATKGVCMFALDCIKNKGTHLGTCIDRFYFGSCCKLPQNATSSSPDSAIISNEILPSQNNGLTPKQPYPSTTLPVIQSNEIATPPTALTTTKVALETTTIRKRRPSTTTKRPRPSIITAAKPSTTPYWTPVTENVVTEGTTAATSSNTLVEDVETSTSVMSTQTPMSSSETFETEPSSSEYYVSMISGSYAESSTEAPPAPSTTTAVTTTEAPPSTTTTTTTPVPPRTKSTQAPSTTTEAPSTTTEAPSTASTEEPFDVMKLADMDYSRVCGRQVYKARPTGRIVNGQKTEFGEWPWQISLRQWKRTTFMHKCGAALLNENWAITAAHCVDGVPPEDLLLRIGEYDLSSDGENLSHVERRVQITTTHPDFNSRTFENDLALLRFYEPVTFQENIIPICLPIDNDTFVNQTGFVTGWGRLFVDGPLPNILQEVQVPVITNIECEQEYRKAGFLESIPDIFLCAGYDAGGRDSCEGDSGGPLVIKQPNNRWVLAGVISWGIGCAEPHQPGVYTRISKFRDWINQILVF